MTGGYMGKILLVNLSTHEIREEMPDDSLYKDFIGGYGIGARILYSFQKGGVDPLGPENILGLVTGPLTGTPATFGCRFTAVAKSPLTGGWGDSNCGGDFGPYLKFSGYDGVFFTGISEKPVYLFIENGKAELRDAAHLWGRDTYKTNEIIQAEHGKDTKVVSIGQAGEKLSYLSCIIHHGPSAAGRSGLGAVMGSKKIKAVAVKGELKVPVANIGEANNLRMQDIIEMKGQLLDQFRKYGTGGHTDISAHSGDTPVKNWGGVGVIDLPDVTGLHKDVVIANVESRAGCWHCPVVCRGRLRQGTTEYKYPEGVRRPEYETLGAFGAMCLNNNAEAIAMANYVCDSYGVDTISAGTIISFAMECFEHGLITLKDTDGIKLNWGNHNAIVAMTEKLAKREGFGDILADGVKAAAERIGKGAEEYAVQIGGQELGMHDPKGSPPAYTGKPMAAMYQMDATPGRHTTGFGPTQFLGYVLNASGRCLHSSLLEVNPNQYLLAFLKAVTGNYSSLDELLKAGERIANIRHVFNLREGINPLQHKVHPRIVGRPPQEEGPLKGVSADLEAQAYWNLGALDWDRVTTKPSKKKLIELGLNDIAHDLWPDSAEFNRYSYRSGLLGLFVHKSEQ